MTARPRRILSIAAIFSLSCLFVPFHGGAGGPTPQEAARAGEEQEQEEVPPVAEPTRPSLFEEEALKPGLYVGAASCASSNCHGGAAPSRQYDVLQNEYFTWLEEDPHAQAYNVLFNEESARIAGNLRLGKEAFQSGVCLDCHTLNVRKERQARPLDLEEGVACESCHGPSSGWLSQHTQGGWTHQDSVEAGMLDLRQIDLRARKCLSCHLGDRRRTVDHELIAAGHPDLIFELDNFSAGMPPHWLRFADRREKGGRRETHGVPAWAVGQAVSFQQGLLQLARRARSDRWPEFADMSCFACHHSLKDGRWRQLRGYKYRAGLPPWSPARWAVLRHLVADLSPREKATLDRLVERLDESVALMNRPQLTAQTAEAMAQQLDRVIPHIETASWGPAQVRQLIGTIAADVDYLMEADIQSAEQAFLALNSLVSFLTERDPRLLQGEMVALLEKIDQELKDRYTFDRNRFAQYLSSLESQVR